MARTRYTQRVARSIAPPKLTLTPEVKAALAILESAQDPVVFLTGRAGTGKSTILRYFRATTAKKLVVLAPTGVAAVNVQGQTIHSFFRFGPDITVDKVRARHDRESGLFTRLQAIVIDEISMVRADLLDCIDAFLRLNGPEPQRPFGGISMIFVGDLYQLPPVVPPEEEKLFRTYYASPYFFDARVLRTCSLRRVELMTVFRQRDPNFVAILDAIRTSAITPTQLARINSRVLRAPLSHNARALVHLVPTNAQAERINAAHLSQLSSPGVVFQGVVTGAFNRKHLPTSEALTLKSGARVMMLANDMDGRWVNGDMGGITAIDADTPAQAITVQLENGYRGVISPYTWEVIRFFYDERHDRIETQVEGSFTQYPLRLAWALTIHKAQGKTFDHLLVDIGSGTFAHGQAYVALSRCTSLEGLVLRTPVEERHIFIDRRVQAFVLGRAPQFRLE
jgi:ATP-dependent DNA helicase PIF1